MDTTSASLLERLRLPAQEDAWRRFVTLYTPLLYHWARAVHLSEQEAADLVQDVLTLLVKKLPEFSYDQQKSFRGWLRTVTLNKWRENQRQRRLPLDRNECERLDEIPDAAASTFEEKEYRQYLVQRALKLMQVEFQPATWKACWECVVGGRPAAEIAGELGISTNAVYLAKSRVLRRLHQELHGLLD
jgi:RNA polymerase sigma-70 factor, ECF subfamily